jgi:hypothetical protein
MKVEVSSRSAKRVCASQQGVRLESRAHDMPLDAFMACSPYTRTKGHDGQPIVSAAMRQPTLQMLSLRISAR